MTKPDKNTVSVVHLVWPPLGLAVFNRFISSYCKYKSGYPHELVLLFNDVADKSQVAPYLQQVKEKNIAFKILVQPSPWQDLDAYFWCASQLDSSYLFFTNSYSEFLAEDWLRLYMSHGTQNGTGITGATGSWQSYYSTVFINNKWTWETKESFTTNFRKFKLLVKASIYWRFLFPSFPNPHMRTNAFLLNRELMLSLRHKPLKNKMAAYRLESGYNNITAQIKRKGLEAIVVDKHGNAYKEDEWISSNVFWKGEQENLLVSDNQTMKYALANEETKRYFSLLAWGIK